MRRSRKISVVHESRETTVFRKDFHRVGLCDFCGFETEVLNLEQAVGFTGLTTREIVRRIDSGTLRFLETKGGLLLFCRNCLLGQSRKLRQETTEEE